MIYRNIKVGGLNSFKERERLYLNNMIPEINLFSLLSSSVLNIKNTNKICSPASHQPIKKLEKDSR